MSVHYGILCLLLFWTGVNTRPEPKKHKHKDKDKSESNKVLIHPNDPSMMVDHFPTDPPSDIVLPTEFLDPCEGYRGGGDLFHVGVPLIEPPSNGNKMVIIPEEPRRPPPRLCPCPPPRPGGETIFIQHEISEEPSKSDHSRKVSRVTSTIFSPS